MAPVLMLAIRGARVDTEAWVYSASVKHSLEGRATPDIWESPPWPINAIRRNRTIATLWGCVPCQGWAGDDGPTLGPVGDEVQ